MYRVIKKGTGTLNDDIRRLYDEYHLGYDLDEGDLVIFRLMGAKFLYSNFEFYPSLPVLPTESDVS